MFVFSRCCNSLQWDSAPWQTCLGGVLLLAYAVSWARIISNSEKTYLCGMPCSSFLFWWFFAMVTQDNESMFSISVFILRDSPWWAVVPWWRQEMETDCLGNTISSSPWGHEIIAVNFWSSVNYPWSLCAQVVTQLWGLTRRKLSP